MNLDLVKIVGVSAAGKSTLVAGLRELGYNARPVAQEHSQVPDMWQRIRPPNWLIFLDADLAAQGERRPDVSWDEPWRRTELKRLAHARTHADLVIDTSNLSPENVLQQATDFLLVSSVEAAPGPLSELPRTGSVWRQN
ncbi:MAG: hypothetical protein F4X14_05300 [Caldilineaceae bacterium SB0661_bin_32]|uniref:AAA family ATPase n=1 Tax=Caldilineaceae bacterium SB0661_bin_32 TaxID=2605255 RepID=A0A6B1D4B0_9CHLR|nr:hypothetical protein [Caldilineaceae bacterium SB0661_bin_32]